MEVGGGHERDHYGGVAAPGSQGDFGPIPPRRGRRRMSRGGVVKVLVVAAPLVGHLTPLLAPATVLREAGHDVLLATGGEAMGVDVGGLPIRQVATPPRWRTALPVALAHPRLAVRDATGHAGIRLAGELFGAINNDGMAEATVAVARSWRPDVVVHEPFAAAGALAAAVLGVPSVLQEISLWDPHDVHAATSGSRAFRRTLRRYHVDQVAPAATIIITPPSLVGERPGHRVRAIPSSGRGELPAWFSTPGGRPRVLVSRSTTNAAPGGDPTRSVIAAAPHVDADFILARGPRGTSLPPNVRVTGWIPLDQALAHVAGFVHHGGAGGVLQSLAAGVPQLAVPGSADRRHNAELLARRGAGLSVEAKRITPDVLEHLITDSALRRAAEQVRAEITGLPDPESLVALIESTTG